MIPKAALAFSLKTCAKLLPPRTRPLISTRNLTNHPLFYFTSSSNPSQISVLQEVEGKVFQVLKIAKPSVANLHRDCTYESLGFDSLDTTELIVQMEDYF